MALLNSNAYGDLAGVSASAAKRTPGKFYKVFITGKKRPGQQVGTMQVMYEIKENNTDSDYIAHNLEKVLFIPYFTKRFWEKNVPVKIQGEDRSQLVAFGWEDDVPKLDDACRYVYVIAGLLINPDTKKAVTHTRDIEDAGIKKGDPVMVYFRCDATKFTGGMNLVNALADRAKSLPPLSDNMEFEKKVVAPRRFMCAATVGSVKTKDYGDKEVYEFVIEMPLPDKAVEQVMNSAKELKADFEKQFNKTAFVKSGTKPSEHSKESQSSGTTVPFDEKPEPVPESKPSDGKGDNFDLGI